MRKNVKLVRLNYIYGESVMGWRNLFHLITLCNVVGLSALLSKIQPKVFLWNTVYEYRILPNLAQCSSGPGSISVKYCTDYLQCSIGPGRPASRLWEMIIKAKSGAYRARYCRHINSLFHHQFASSRSEATMEWHFQSFPARFLRSASAAPLLCRAATVSASTPASNLGVSSLDCKKCP